MPENQAQLTPFAGGGTCGEVSAELSPSAFGSSMFSVYMFESDPDYLAEHNGGAETRRQVIGLCKERQASSTYIDLNDLLREVLTISKKTRVEEDF